MLSRTWNTNAGQGKALGTSRISRRNVALQLADGLGAAVPEIASSRRAADFIALNYLIHINRVTLFQELHTPVINLPK